MKTSAKRHVFVTFWLYLMIMINIIYLIPSISRALRYNDILEGVDAVFNMVNILAVVLIMKWRKVGFFILLLMCAKTLIFIVRNHSGFDSEMLMLNVAGCIISPLVLYIILQIKKDGVSCWEQMK